MTGPVVQSGETLDSPSPEGRRVGTPPAGPLLVRLVNADEPALPSARYLLTGLTEVALGRSQEGGAELSRARLTIPVADRFASASHSLLAREGGEWSVRDQGSRNGTVVDGRPLAAGEVRPLGREALIEVGHTFFLFRSRAELLPSAPRLYEPGPAEPEPATLCPEWARELARAEQLAPTEHELLLLGESGVGKEVLARRLHALSRPRGPFVGLNCGAVPEHLLENELFGHVRGAFSGAQGERAGLLRAADGGTLFLDEIGDMPPTLQVKLLRVLEEHKVRPLGTEREEAVDVRIVAATHRDVTQLVADGKFRQDLLARIGLLPVRLPPLRARREDLGLLLRAVLRADGALEGLVFDCLALRTLLSHDWPLNVRELRKVVTSAAALARAAGGKPPLVTCDHFPELLRTPRPRGPAPIASPRTATTPPLCEEDARLREQILELLTSHGGNLAAVARALDCTRSMLQRRLARFGIDPTRHRGRGEPPHE